MKRFKEMKSASNGITLIGLVITIVIIVILSGVTLSTLMGENGILIRAESVVEKNEEAADKEKILLALKAYKIDEKTKSGAGSIADIMMQEEWCNDAVYDEETEITTVTIKECGHQYKVALDGTILLDEIADVEDPEIPPIDGDEPENPLPEEPEEIERELIPEGGIYTTAEGTVYNAGEYFPETVTTGDIYQYGDYEYQYNKHTSGDGSWFKDETLNGWGVDTIDNTKSSYGKFLTTINGAKIGSLKSIYRFCSELTSIDLSNLDTSNVKDFESIFSRCSSLTSVNLSGWDMSSVIDMQYMFSDCTSLTTVNLSGFDMSSVTNMSHMFDGCTKLASLDFSNVDTSSLKLMTCMFWCCEKLSSINLSGFDTNNVTKMYGTFYKCSSLNTLDISSFITSNVTDMRYMFQYCTNLKNIYVGDGWDTSNVTSNGSMFSGCGTSSVTKKT